MIIKEGLSLRKKREWLKREIAMVLLLLELNRPATLAFLLIII
jgi:hypothetical protein